MTQWLSRGESGGYAALDRAREGNHIMMLDDRWPVVGSCWRCACGASVAMTTTAAGESMAEVNAEVDKPCATWELRNSGPYTVQDDIDELFGPESFR